MKTILFTINYYHRGGPSRVIYNIIKSMDKSKYKIKLLTLMNLNDEEYTDKLRKMGVEVIELNYNKNLITLIKNRNNILSKYNEINADIIHAHGLVTTMLISSSKIKAKKIVTVHNNMYEDYYATYGKLKGFFYIYFHLRALRNIDKIICCSKSVYESLKGKFTNSTYIRNGIDPDKPNENCDIRKELNIPQNAIVYTYCGSLTKRKRILDLVKMFSNSINDDEYFLIVGARGMLDEIKKYENNHIKVLGFRNNVMDFYKASDVYVSYSSSEGFSISIIEALSQGLLLLVSDIPSHNECFDIDNNYYLGEYFNEESFEEKKIVIRNKLLNNRKEAIIGFQNKYLSSNAMAKEYEKYYDNISK